MFEKNGKFFADWRDRDGRRKRKSFTSQRAALRYEAEQRELAQAKRRGRGTHLPKYSAPTTTLGGKHALKPRLLKRSLP